MGINKNRMNGIFFMRGGVYLLAGVMSSLRASFNNAASDSDELMKFLETNLKGRC